MEWEPGGETVVAVATALATIGVYFANSRIDPENFVAGGLVFIIFGSIFLNVVFPTW